MPLPPALVCAAWTRCRMPRSLLCGKQRVMSMGSPWEQRYGAVLALVYRDGTLPPRLARAYRCPLARRPASRPRASPRRTAATPLYGRHAVRGTLLPYPPSACCGAPCPYARRGTPRPDACPPAVLGHPALPWSTVHRAWCSGYARVRATLALGMSAWTLSWGDTL